MLTVNAAFFQAAENRWLDQSTLPPWQLKDLDIESLPTKVLSRLRESVSQQSRLIPVLFGEPMVRIGQQDASTPGAPPKEPQTDAIHCEIDIFGSIFFMLSRYEEAVVSDQDEHDRFPATASVAYRAGFLDRPVVNEYVELLWAMMKTLWPGLQRKARQFTVRASHDVDVPYNDAFRPLSDALRRTGGDLLKRRDCSAALENLHRWYRVRRGYVALDRNNTFDFIMTESERRGLRSAFYFLADTKDRPVHCRYSLHGPAMVDLIRRIDHRSHEIGLHTSFYTYQDPKRTADEADALRTALTEIGVGQQIRGGRQHYLRWETPTTFQNWNAAGMEYDSTLGYADRAGFRCGTCWPYPVYDVFERRTLPLMEYPLVVMEASVLSHRYMNKSGNAEAYDVFKRLKDTCRAYSGDYTLLWHNSELTTDERRELYLAVLDA